MNAIMAIASTTLGEAIRRKTLLIIMAIGLVFLIIAPSISTLAPRGQREVLVGLVLGVLKITSAILAVTLTVYLLPNEVERRTIYTILSKPVQRSHFLIGKFLGSVGALTLMLVLMSVVLIVAFAIQQQAYNIGDLAPIIKPAFLLVFQMALLAAVAMLFSTFAPPVINFFLTGLVFIFGTLMNPIFEAFGAKDSAGGVSIIARVAHYAIPNFGSLDISTGASDAAQQLRGSEAVYIGQGILYALVYISILIVVSVLIFDNKEV